MMANFGPRRPKRRFATVVAVIVCATAMMGAGPAQANTVSIVRYDATSIAQYGQMWSNPYGLGEMAVNDTRAVSPSGVFSIDAIPFRTSYDYSVYDHIKYLAISKQSFGVPSRGSVAFSVNISASTPGAVPGHVIYGQYGPPGSYDPTKPDTYSHALLEGQQAGVVLNMISFCTGQLFDWFVSGEHVFPLYERLPTTVTGNTSNPNCPGATPVGLDKAFTQVVSQLQIAPNSRHNVGMVYSRTGTSNNVTYVLDGRPVASIDNVGVPLAHPYAGTYPAMGSGENLSSQINAFQIGHGLFSLLDVFPFQYGCTPPTNSGPGTCDPSTLPYSVSIPTSHRDFGQGAAGSFDHFTVVTASS